jgi:large subunit ribosomal protein L4
MNKKTTTNNFTAPTVQPVLAQDLNFDVDMFERASKSLFSVSIRRLTKNWQQGTVACQGRSDVSRTNKKPWKQKGTGRARAGSARSPLWKGGGVIFGPQARVRTLKLPKKARQKVMATVLADYLTAKNVVCADWSMIGEQPKTSQAKEFLNSTGLSGRKVVLFVAPYDFHIALSFANIPNVRPISFDQTNAYDLINSDCWLFLKKDMDHFKEMVRQWL